MNSVLGRRYFLLALSLLLMFTTFVGPQVAAISSEQRAIYSSGLNWFDVDSPLQCQQTGSLSTPGNVYIIGDSLTVRAENLLREQFAPPWNLGEEHPNNGGSDLVNAVESRRVGEAPALLGADSAKISSANAIVIALGTNNFGSDISDEITSTIGTIRSSNASAPVFWVDAASTKPGDFDFEPVNKAIYDNSSTLGYRVISWFQTVFPGKNPVTESAQTDDPNSFLDPDGIHQTTAPGIGGTTAFAKLIFDSVSKSIAPTSDPGPASSTTSQSNGEIAYNFLRSRGLTAEQSAGVVGNLMSESGSAIDPTIVNSSSGAFGIAQWLGGRKTNLENFALAVKRPVNTLETQLDYLWFEITGDYFENGLPKTVQGTPENPVDAGREGASYEAIVLETTVAGAARTWVIKFERSGDTEAIKRIAFAEEVYESFKNNPVTDSPFYSSVVCQAAGEFNSINIISGDTTHIPCTGEFESDKLRDGYRDGQKYRIRVCTVKLPDGSGGPQVNSQISGVVYQMIHDAARAGVELSGGSYRSMAAQIQKRIDNCSKIDDEFDPDMYLKDAGCSPAVARPGYSNHQMGLAIDFHQVPKSCVRIDRDGNDRYCAQPEVEAWQWLDTNAGSYGLKQLQSEAWHWSDNGG